MRLIPWTHPPGSETKRKGHVMSKLINIKWKIVNILKVKNIYDNRSTPMRYSFELYVLFDNLSHVTMLLFFEHFLQLLFLIFNLSTQSALFSILALFPVEVFSI